MKTINGFKVRFVTSRILKDYAGMNYYAGKRFRFKPLPKPNEVFIDEKLSPKMRRKTIAHEIAEARLMRRGASYWYAHNKALQAEKRVK